MPWAGGMKLLLVAVLTSLGIAVARDVVELDRGWKFSLGEIKDVEEVDFDDRAWCDVEVPHDWSIEGEFSRDAPAGGAGGWLPTGVAWYRRSIAGPVEGQAWLDFDGVMANSEIWLNGELVAKRPNGYISFICDITGKLDRATNVLVVKSDTSAQPASRWYAGAGIYRKVRLVIADPLHVSPWGVQVLTPEVGPDSARVVVKTTVNNASAGSAAFTLRTTLLGPDGRALGKSDPDHQLDAEASREFSCEFDIDDPKRWDMESPQLYQVECDLLVNGTVIDKVRVPFGLRRAEFRSETGFWLNDRNVKLKGVCLHHCGGGVGTAVPLDVWERRLGLLKKLGVNAIRNSHNPVDPGFLDLCDRMGFLVMNEAFDCWTRGKNPHDYHRFFQEWAKQDLTDMIRRDRNHPSVILYSVGNEIRDMHDSKKARETLEMLVKTCHENDPERPVTLALFRPNTTGDYENGLADLLDVIGTNYRDAELLDAWKAKPGRCIVGTEQGHERSTWFLCRDHPHHAGQFLWTGIDYLGESREWPVNSYNSGLLDRTGRIQPRGWERMSWWSEEPMVKAFRRIGQTEATPEDPGYEVIEWRRRQVLFPDWTPENPGEQNVEVYTNAEEAELFLNGRSLGTKKVRKDFALNWKVAFEAGVLRVVARKGGKEVATDELMTAGEPAALRVRSDRSELSRGFDRVAHLEVEVVDAKGVLVPRASNEVEFRIRGAGRLVAVDSGSISSHERFRADRRRAFQGELLAVVRAEGGGDEIIVEASSADLKSATLRLKVPKSP